MDEKDKQKVEDIKRIHDCAVNLNAVGFGVERERHKDRGELLAIIDRLLASTAHDQTEPAKYKSFGEVSDALFGLGHNLRLADDQAKNVFVKHNGVQWRVSALMQANDRLVAENKILKSNAINNQRTINGLLTTLDERNATIDRKDALLIEKDKEIKALKLATQPGSCGIIPYEKLSQYSVEIQPAGYTYGWGPCDFRRIRGKTANLADLVREAGKVASALRSTQEDVGELRIELADALDELETANIRLDVIEDTINGHNDDCVDADDTIDEPEINADDLGQPGDETVFTLVIDGNRRTMRVNTKE